MTAQIDTVTAAPAPTTATATTLVYVQGVGYVSPRYAMLREQLKVLIKSLSTNLDLDNLDWNIINENSGRAQILVSGLNKDEISRQKIRTANYLRGTIYPGIRLLNSKTRGYTIWNCYFSDGNFNAYACGFEFDMPIETAAK